MSNTNDLAEKKLTEQQNDLPIQPLTAEPVHGQFSTTLSALLLTIIMALALISTLFYQQSERTRFVIEGELTPLKQQIEQRQALQKAEYIINELLFTDSGIHFVGLQTELIAVNKKLLALESSNTSLYQQWLNASRSTSDTAIRIQQNYERNEQLKQSSVVQLQLMWFSITPIIDKKIAQQAIFLKQLQAGKANGKTTLWRANRYVNATNQLFNLQQFKHLLTAVLTRFEQLSIHTSMDELGLLRLDVEKIIAQTDTLKTEDQTQGVVDFSQQIETFEDIVLTQQNVLATWQDYIRLVQSYQLGLTMQNNQLMKILAEPQENRANYVSGTLNNWLNKIKVAFNIKVTQETLSKALLLAIGLSLFIVCYLLWRLRERIKRIALQNVVVIHERGDTENNNEVQVKCVEAQEIMQPIQTIVEPIHSEQEFQLLLQQCRAYQQIIDDQTEALEVYTQSTNQPQLDNSEQVALHLQSELQRYKYLEEKVLSFLQQQQAILANKIINSDEDKAVQFSSLIPVYEQLKQFYLASNIRSESAMLTLTDVNLIDEIHAILINKQTEQQKVNNQIYFSYDDQLLVQAQLDLCLFQQLIHLLIDISLLDYRDTQLHLHLQLQDKGAGQQSVHFVITIKTEGEVIEALPDLVSLLIATQVTTSQKSPLVDIFNVLFVRQQGENILAHLIDEGFQLSFELPLAIVSSSGLTEQQESEFNGVKVMLLSRNSILTELLEKIIHSASSRFEVLGRIDSFEQQFTAERLKKRKLDLLIVASDIAGTNIDLITQRFDSLPVSMQPKLMILQSAALPFNDFGCYSQCEQLLFKDAFLHNVKELLAGETRSNQLLSPEQCQYNHYLASELPVILAVNSPQQYQNFQRLLRWLGLQVRVVSHADTQRELWETGLYCILFTEFPETSLLKMASKPLVDVAVFSLTDEVPSPENTYLDGWHIGQLVEESTLTELSVALAPWLKPFELTKQPENTEVALPDKSIEYLDEINRENREEIDFSEIVMSLTEDNNDEIVDFSQYLRHQGSFKLALFMLDDYAQDNHQQLDILIDAIKTKDIDKAKKSLTGLQLNAKILAAVELERLCLQWSELLSGNEIPNSLKEVNVLLKETRTALVAIDGYVESI